MNEEIAEIFAKHYPFTSRQILDFYNGCKSWDMVVHACKYSQTAGTSTLTFEWALEGFERPQLKHIANVMALELMRVQNNLIDHKQIEVVLKRYRPFALQEAT